MKKIAVLVAAVMVLLIGSITVAYAADGGVRQIVRDRNCAACVAENPMYLPVAAGQETARSGSDTDDAVMLRERVRDCDGTCDGTGEGNRYGNGTCDGTCDGTGEGNRYRNGSGSGTCDGTCDGICDGTGDGNRYANGNAGGACGRNGAGGCGKASREAGRGA